MRALKFVFVCQQNPWRLDGGALIRNYWLVRALAERYEVDLVTADDPAEPVARDFAGAYASLARFPRPAGGAFRRARLLGTLRPRGSYFTSGSVTRRLRRAVRALAARGDAVAMTDLQMCDAVPASLPLVYDAHNAEYALLGRRAALERGAAAAFVRLEARRVAALERRFVRRALAVAACSEEDRSDLLRLAPEAGAKILVVPNGVDLERYAAVAESPGDDGTILVTGSYDWRPNRAALDWLCAEVLPALRARRPAGDFRVRVAGRMDPVLAASLRALPNVEAVPHPPDMRVELARASIVAAPVLASSGTRLRVLEAWAAGRPVVTTPAGAFGLAYRDGADLLLGDGAAAFAEALSRLLDDPALRERVRAAALLRAERYAWPLIGRRFLAECEPLLPRPGV